MLTKRIIGGLVAACFVGSLGVAAPAHAEKYKAKDASGDVVTFDELGTTTPHPENTDADIVKSVVNHSKTRVNIKVKLRDLTGVGSDEAIELIADIKSNIKRQAAILVKFGSDKPTVELVRGAKSLRCTGLKKKVSASKNLVKLSVPRRCLGNPRWVKVGIGAFSIDANGFFVDDGLAASIDLNGDLKFTPKLKRG